MHLYARRLANKEQFPQIHVPTLQRDDGRCADSWCGLMSQMEYPLRTQNKIARSNAERYHTPRACLPSSGAPSSPSEAGESDSQYHLPSTWLATAREGKQLTS